jgi:WS/DGAT/MGAT family acyltransferase
MQQLTEMDYAFVQMESNRAPMHISPVIFYDQSDLAAGPVRFKQILEVFRHNLHKSAIFRRKLSGGALGLDTPYWVEDADFDLEFHVRHIALPKPGDWRQLCILLARLHARGLDMTRPLWEAYVIEGLNEVEGLPPRSFAIMLKVHHAAIDGVSGAEILSAIHSPSPEPPPETAADDWQGEQPPSTLKVWSNAYLNNLRRPVRMVETLGKLVPKLIRANRLTGDREEASPPKSPAGKTRFNQRVSTFRVTDAIVLDLATIRSLKNAVEGATVNDVIVSVVGGGLRKYLQAKGELPASSLSCGAPINVRADRNSHSIGNQVGMMTIDMATDIEEALPRLRAVTEHARESKAYSSALGAKTMLELSQGLWPSVVGIGMRAATLAAVSGEMALPIHTVVSNVPGPQMPLYLAGARVHMLMGLGPTVDMMGLFHAVISGAGKITVNFVCCREMMPDPDFYRECLQGAYDELEAAVQAQAGAVRRKPASRKKTSPAGNSTAAAKKSRGKRGAD